VKDNARFFGAADKVPRHVITMGVGTIMDARACLLLATGESKAEAVVGMAEGPITANLPVNFDASASQAGAGASQIVSYNWAFGDGSTGSGRTVSHSY